MMWEGITNLTNIELKALLNTIHTLQKKKNTLRPKYFPLQIPYIGAYLLSNKDKEIYARA